MARLWKKVVDAAGRDRMQAVDLSTLSITSPTIVYLPGIFVVDKRPGGVAGTTKRLERILGEWAGFAEKPPQIYTWSHTGLKSVFNQRAYNRRPETICSGETQPLARNLIMPLVSDDNGRPLPLEEARKRLRNLTLVGYCAGAVVAQEIYNASVGMMQGIGYKENEARELLQEIVLVSFGTASRPFAEKNRFTSVYLAARNDYIIRFTGMLWGQFRNAYAKFSANLAITPVSATSILATADVEKRTWEWRKAPDGTMEKKPINLVLPEWTGLHTNHEPAQYLNCDDGFSPFSKIVLYALINAVNRTGKLAPVKLLEPALSHTPAELDAYRARIAAALDPSLPPLQAGSGTALDGTTGAEPGSDIFRTGAVSRLTPQ